MINDVTLGMKVKANVIKLLSQIELLFFQTLKIWKTSCIKIKIMEKNPRKSQIMSLVRH